MGRIVNSLVEQGVRVLAGSSAGVHASGHAAQEELRFLLELVRPRYFVPVHGEPRHLAAHVQIATAAGLDPQAVAIVENGAVVEVSDAGLRVSGDVSVGSIPIDAEGRSHRGIRPEASAGGTSDLVVVSITMDRALRRVVAGPETVVSSASPTDHLPLIDQGRAKVRRAVRDHRRDFRDAAEVRRVIGSTMETHLAESGSWQPRVVAVVSLA